MSNYQVPKIAEWFHHFPRFYYKENITFAPQDSDYVRALVILAVVPLAFLIAILLVLLCYFLVRRSAEIPRKKNLGPLKTTIFVFGILLSISLALGLYGNGATAEGMATVTLQLDTFRDVIAHINNQISTVDDLVSRDITKVILAIDHASSFISNATIVSMLKDVLEKITGTKGQIISEIHLIDNITYGLSMTHITEAIENSEHTRWTVTIACLCLAILVIILTFYGVGKKSVCSLKGSCILGIVFLTVFWIGMGLYLALAVGIGDFCVDPKGFLVDQVRSDQRPFINYYLDCTKETDNPCTQTIKTSEDFITQSYKLVNKTFLEVGKLFPDTEIFNDTQKLLGLYNRTTKAFDQLLALMDCLTINKSYNIALNSLCLCSLYGLAYTLLACLISLFLLIGLAVLSSRTWVHFKRITRRHYVDIDEQDPFLPPSISTIDSYGSFGYRPSEETVNQPNSIYADFLIKTNSGFFQNSVQSTSPLVNNSPPPAYHIFDQANYSTSEGQVRTSSPKARTSH